MIKKYDWKITAQKVAIIAGELILSSIIAYLTDNAYFLALVPILEGLRNWVKNRNL